MDQFAVTQKIGHSHNGPEYVSGKLMEWAEKRNVRLEYIQPG